MKDILLFLGLLFAGTHVFAQESSKLDPDKIQYKFRSLSGKTTTVEPDQLVAKPNVISEIPLADNISPEKTAAERTPEVSTASAIKEVTIEDIDREMSKLVSRLPREQRESIRKSNGEMYDYIPAAAFVNGKGRLKSRRVIQIMPASASAVPISSVEAYNKGIEVILYEIYKSN